MKLLRQLKKERRLMKRKEKVLMVLFVGELFDHSVVMYMCVIFLHV